MSHLHFYLYHCSEPLQSDWSSLLKPEPCASLLRPALRQAIESSSSFYTDTLNHFQPIIIRVFTQSFCEQYYVAVSVSDLQELPNEKIDEYENRLKAEALNRLHLFLGKDYDEQKIKQISSLIWLAHEADELKPSNVVYKQISYFLRGTYALDAGQFKILDNIKYIKDGQGLGILSLQTHLPRAKQLLLLLVLAHAYLSALGHISKHICAILPKLAPKDPDQNKPEQEWDNIIHFLIQYYYSEPILPQNNEPFMLYQVIKERLHIENQYQETKEQLRLFTEIIKNYRHQSVRVEEKENNRQDAPEKAQALANKTLLERIMFVLGLGAALGIGCFILLLMIFFKV